MRMPNGSENTYSLSVVIEEQKPLRYFIKVLPRWSVGYHPRDVWYSNYKDAYLHMWMPKTETCQFESHGAHWSVEVN